MDTVPMMILTVPITVKNLQEPRAAWMWMPVTMIQLRLLKVLANIHLMNVTIVRRNVFAHWTVPMNAEELRF